MLTMIDAGDAATMDARLVQAAAGQEGFVGAWLPVTYRERLRVCGGDGVLFSVTCPGRRVEAERAVSAARRYAAAAQAAQVPAGLAAIAFAEFLSPGGEHAGVLGALREALAECAVCDHAARCCMEHGTHAEFMHFGCLFR